MHFCVAEDRPGEAVALKLLVCSLNEHAPGARVRMVYPAADAAFLRWAASFPNCTVITQPLAGASGWNVKPHALLTALDAGLDDVTWIDSDIVATAPLAPLFANLDPQTIVATEETCWGQHQGGTHRTTAWGLAPGRKLASTCNTGVLRVTAAHRPLLEHWKALLESPVYQRAQARPSLERPIHMLSDQEVFTALMGAAAYAHFPLRQLRRDVEIVQHFGPSGFTPRSRLRSLVRGTPALIHAMGIKPWHYDQGGRGLRDRYNALAAETSAYTLAAQRHATNLAPGERVWLARRSVLGRLMRWGGWGHVSLVGLPLALVDGVVRWVRRALKIARFPVAADGAAPSGAGSP